jgi:hypothetical protein
MTETVLFAFVWNLLQENRTLTTKPRWAGRFPGEFWFTWECFDLRTAHIKN